MMPSNHSRLTRGLRVGDAAYGASSLKKQVRANPTQACGGDLPFVSEFAWQTALLPSLVFTGDDGLVRGGEGIPRSSSGGPHDH